MLKKILALALIVLMVSVNAYAMEITRLANVKAAADDSNLGRDHVDIIVRYFPDDRGLWATGIPATALLGAAGANSVASEGAIVIWATQDAAVIGRDVTVCNIIDAALVAGIVVEPGGISSGDYGRVRIYGYFDDVIAADSTDAVAQGTKLGTTAGVIDGTGVAWGQVGASGGSDATTAGICFDAGSGADLAEVQAMIEVGY